MLERGIYEQEKFQRSGETSKIVWKKSLREGLEKSSIGVTVWFYAGYRNE